MASSISSGTLTTNTLVYTGKNYVNGLLVNTDGANAATVTIYDNTSGSGLVLAQVVAPGSGGTKDVMFNKAVRADNGLYITVSGTGASAIVHYGTT